MEKIEDRVKRLLQKCEISRIDKKQFSKLEINEKFGNTRIKKMFFCVFVLVFAVAIQKFYESYKDNSCFWKLDLKTIFRPPEFCEICENVTKIDKISKVSPEDFYWDYIKPSKPVVVTDGAQNWRAKQEFSFNFLKNVYESVPEEEDLPDCQFFGYETEFKSLYQVFNMSESRANLEPGEKPWYIGFSNCNNNAGKILRDYFEKPYFLPESIENVASVWVFMGGPGHGAHMHVDSVIYPSWQAQLSGRKKWIFAPPPECYYSCQKLEVTVEPGEIIVLDSNRWYHQTFVQPGDISITVGTEFH